MELRLLILLGLLCTLGLAWPIDVHAQSQIVLTRRFPSAAPCSGLFSLTGFTGCSSKKDNNKNVGELRFFKSINDITDVIATKNFTGSYVVSAATWCLMTKDILEQLNPLATSLIVVEEPGATHPNCLSPSRYNSAWNKFGSKSALATLHYPISRISESDSSVLLNYMSSSGTQKARYEFYMGKTDGSVNTEVCLRQGKCLPLGGLSSWGTVHSPPYSSGEAVILITTNLDSSAFFHDLSFGFHASGGDIVVLLATLEILARLPITPVRIIGAVFQGEAFNRIGSRRFVEDVVYGQCDRFSSRENKTCSNPPSFSLEFTKFEKSLSPFKSVISLSNVLRTDVANNATNLFRTSKTNDLTSTIAERFIEELDGLGAGRPGNFVQPHESLPPSPLSSFTEHTEWQQLSDNGGFVVAGYEMDVSEANPHYQTEDDVMNLDKLDDYIVRVDAIASSLARSIYFAASNGTETSLRANTALVRDLLVCFGGDFVGNCTLAQYALNRTETGLRDRVRQSSFAAEAPYGLASSLPLASYTGVYSALPSLFGGVKVREEFVRNLLANVTLGGSIPAPGQQEPSFHCSSDVTCRDSWPDVLQCGGQLASNASVACVGGRCVCTTTFYHEAWSVGLRLNANGAIVLNRNSSVDTEVWTEPYWISSKLSAFTAGSAKDAAAVLVVGILLIVATIFGLSWAKRKGERLGKFKLA